MPLNCSTSASSALETAMPLLLAVHVRLPLHLLLEHRGHCRGRRQRPCRRRNAGSCVLAPAADSAPGVFGRSRCTTRRVDQGALRPCALAGIGPRDRVVECRPSAGRCRACTGRCAAAPGRSRRPPRSRSAPSGPSSVLAAFHASYRDCSVSQSKTMAVTACPLSVDSASAASSVGNAGRCHGRAAGAPATCGAAAPGRTRSKSITCCDGAVLEHLEVVLREVDDRVALLVAHDDVDDDGRRGRAELRAIRSGAACCALRHGRRPIASRHAARRSVGHCVISRSEPCTRPE